MPETVDPDEPISPDPAEADPQDARRRRPEGAKADQPVSADAEDGLPDRPDTESDSGIEGGVDEPNESTDAVFASEVEESPDA